MTKQRVRHHVNPLSDLTEIAFSGFGNDKPIIVDVGADRGEFSQGILDRYGDRYNLIVSEIRKPLAVKLEDKFAPYPYVKVVAGDFVRNVRALLEPAIKNDGVHIEKVFINFPDPWFKDRHHKRRVVGERLIENISGWMGPETWWYFQTDQAELFRDTREFLLGCELVEVEFEFDEDLYEIETKWGAAKRAAGYEINRLRFRLSA